MNFFRKLERAIECNNSLLCVGLDPTESMLENSTDIYGSLLSWAQDLVTSTQDLVCAYKPNIAFFEAFGPKGYRALADILAWMPAEIPILLDEKRGDIGSTADAYARAAWQHLGADAVTLSPYLGADSVKPFLADPEKAVFVLCQTSNPSARELQNHGNPPLYQFVAQLALSWGGPDQVGLVIGATQPDALQSVRATCPETWFLAPGFGAQGGNLQEALESGLREDGLGMIIPVSRSVMQAPDPRRAAAALRDEINAIRNRLAETGKGLDLAATSDGQSALKTEDGEAASATESPKIQGSQDQRLIHRLFQCGCLKFGEFTLASGKSSPVYLDLRRLVSFPDLMDLAVEAYVDLLVKIDYDTIAGVPYAALPAAAIASSKLQKPMVYARKEAKDHGTGQMVEGVFEPGQKAVMIEDVITSGGSILQAAETLKAAGLEITDAIVLVDREQGGVEKMLEKGIRVHAVLKFSEILDLLKAGNFIDDATFKTVTDHLSVS